MLKVKNKSEEEIAKIGKKIGEAFAAEKAGIHAQGFGTAFCRGGGEKYSLCAEY